MEHLTDLGLKDFEDSISLDAISMNVHERLITRLNAGEFLDLLLARTLLDLCVRVQLTVQLSHYPPITPPLPTRSLAC
jgi:hypothetical protein